MHRQKRIRFCLKRIRLEGGKGVTVLFISFISECQASGPLCTKNVSFFFDMLFSSDASLTVFFLSCSNTKQSTKSIIKENHAIKLCVCEMYSMMCEHRWMGLRHAILFGKSKWCANVDLFFQWLPNTRNLKQANQNHYCNALNNEGSGKETDSVLMTLYPLKKSNLFKWWLRKRCLSIKRTQST